MPQAKKPSRSTRGRTTFREPAAMKRLNKSLDNAQQALTELSKKSGRDVGTGANDLAKNLRSFVTDARRDTRKLARALQRDFDQAQKKLTASTTQARGASRSRRASRTSGRRTSDRSTKRSTTRRSTAKRS